LPSGIIFLKTHRVERGNTKMRKYRLPTNLKEYGYAIHSQNDEDGIIESIFNCIKPNSKYFVEFGTAPSHLHKDYSRGLEGNCVNLKNQGWSGLMMDGNKHPEIFDVKEEFITPLNINSLLRKYDVPFNCDLISIDVDGQDFWIWMAIDYAPTLFIIEYNPSREGPEDSVTVPYNPEFRWDWTDYYGASLAALAKCGENKGYTLVYSNGVNAFFVRTDLIVNVGDFELEKVGVWFQHHPADPSKRAWLKV
jgi:hypothetical protein